MSQSKNDFMAVREYETAVSGISFEHLIDAKKSNLVTAVATITTQVQDGEYDSLKALILAKKGSELFSLLEKSIRPLAEDNYVFKLDKDYILHDVKIEQAETGVKYSFENCEDPIWNDLKAEHDKATELLKERETFLKAVSKPMDIVINEAEVYNIKPPVRSGKVGLKLTIK